MSKKDVNFSDIFLPLRNLQGEYNCVGNISQNIPHSIDDDDFTFFEKKSASEIVSSSPNPPKVILANSVEKIEKF